MHEHATVKHHCEQQDHPYGTEKDGSRAHIMDAAPEAESPQWVASGHP
jgi:hypothetical protein